MGLNAFFAFTVVGTMGYPWPQALGLVFLSGCLFVLLTLPNAGDELQGIKKGVLELADLVAVNKADDGEGERRASAAASEYRAALHILSAPSSTWTPPVVTISGLNNKGLDGLWERIVDHRNKLTATGEIAAKRTWWVASRPNITTSQPLASTSAAARPAGPAPTTATSSLPELSMAP